MKLTKEAPHWYRSAMVWFLAIAGVMKAVQIYLPDVQALMPETLYETIMNACVVVAGFARFVEQTGMKKAVEGRGDAQ